MEKPLRSIGVSVTDFIHDDQPHQMSLLRDEKRLIQNEQLDKTLDRLKKRFGNYAVRPAVLLDDKELDFNPKEDHTPSCRIFMITMHLRRKIKDVSLILREVTSYEKVC